ncbi:hypothetical protein PROVRUST_07771 [Providencia rustigianii DSM 4541]|uniref:Uncharacterized protein n=1 Tax=Providencia rustigianii DSM 4541 TaxID=500637 RepID=D1P6A6_9GAMM|nr:hypothetical protein PROVRUST_07771 [Providencia rustigianii DSM 4541]
MLKLSYNQSAYNSLFAPDTPNCQSLTRYNAANYFEYHHKTAMIIGKNENLRLSDSREKI